MRVFISYSFNDEKFVRRVSDCLKDVPGLAPFCYGDDRGAERWLVRIGKELSKMDAFLIFVGDKVGRTQVDEIAAAITLKAEKGLLVLLGPDQLPPELAMLHAWPKVMVTRQDDDGARNCAQQVARLFGIAEPVQARIEEPVKRPSDKPIEPPVMPPPPTLPPPKGPRWRLLVSIGLIVVLLAGLVAIRLTKTTLLPPPDMASQIAEFEKLIDRYYRRNPAEAAKAKAENTVNDYNAWLKQNESAMEDERNSTCSSAIIQPTCHTPGRCSMR